jgi:hypothetical protein
LNDKLPKELVLMDYEKAWKELKARIEAKVGSGDRTLHDGTLLQVVFMMNAAEMKKTQVRKAENARV